MFLARATASCLEREPAHGHAAMAAVGALGAPTAPRGALGGLVWALGALAPLLVAGCGAPNPRILEATEEARGLPSTELGTVMTEQDKIRELIAKVRKSDFVFVLDGIERDGSSTADKLQLLLERDPTGVRSAREFIDRIAAPEREDEDSDRVLTSKDPLAQDASVPARHWYLVALAELEQRLPPPTPPEEQREAEIHARRLLILDALAIVEHSSLKFVAPPRGGASKPVLPASKKLSTGLKRKPKRKEYDGVQFAEMLRTKWEFLGADIQDLDAFIDEIASDSFAGMVRYRVVLEDGSEEDFGVWLRQQLGPQRNEEATTLAQAQGGAP